MRHKFLASALSVAATLCLGLGFSACGDETDQNSAPEVHHHTYTVDNVCSGCGDVWEYTEGL